MADDATVLLCRRCGERLSSEALRCPECDADPRTGLSASAREGLDRVRVCQGVWVRCAALAIDVVIAGFACLALAFVVFAVELAAGMFSGYNAAPPSWPVWTFVAAGVFVYFWWSEARWGRTLGKRLLDLRVVGVDGSRPGLARSFVRNALRVVDFLPLLFVLGAAVIATTPKDQRIGDLAARTVVVRRRTLPVAELAQTTLPVVPWGVDRA